MKFSALGLLAYHLVFLQLACPLLKISSKVSELERDLPVSAQRTGKSNETRNKMEMAKVSE